MEKITKVNKGERLLIVGGDFADKRITGIFKVLEDFDMEALKALYQQEYPERMSSMEGESYGNAATLAMWLIEKKLVAELSYRQLSFEGWGKWSDGITDMWRLSEKGKNLG